MGLCEATAAARRSHGLKVSKKPFPILLLNGTQNETIGQQRGLPPDRRIWLGGNVPRGMSGRSVFVTGLPPPNRMATGTYVPIVEVAGGRHATASLWAFRIWQPST